MLLGDNDCETRHGMPVEASSIGLLAILTVTAVALDSLLAHQQAKKALSTSKAHFGSWSRTGRPLSRLDFIFSAISAL